MNLEEFFQWHMKERNVDISYEKISSYDKACWNACYETWLALSKPELNLKCKGYSSGPIFIDRLKLWKVTFGVYTAPIKPPEPEIQKPKRILN